MFVVVFSVSFALMSASVGTEERFIAVDRFVPHVSTVPANAGQKVGIYLHEKLSESVASQIEQGQAPSGRVVLFVHGGSVSSVPDYDLPFKDYSWMEYLAEAGFDTFAMDQSGYGRSPRPMMDDPCNMNETNQAIVTPNPLSGPCEPSYKFGLTTSQSDWDEIETVVDFIRVLRGVDRVSLVGWSAGGPRTGGYAARHPDKVDKLILFAPGYRSSGPSEPPADLLRPGVPMRLQTYDTLAQGRWEANVACEGQVDPGVREVIWQTIMAFDSLGSVWGPQEGVMRVRAGNSGWGWNAEYAARVKAPTLILVGEQDGLLPSSEALYSELDGTSNKVLVKMACGTHFAVWEASQYKFMHEASKEWLTKTEFRGQRQGIFSVGANGSEPSGR